MDLLWKISGVIILVIIYFTLIAVFDVMHESGKKEYYAQEKIKFQIIKGQPVPSYKSSYETFEGLLWNLYLYLAPIFIILLSISDIYENKKVTISSYYKSLFIPITYIGSSYIMMSIYFANIRMTESEGGMLILFVLIQFAITLLISVIANSVVYFIKRYSHS